MKNIVTAVLLLLSIYKISCETLKNECPEMEKFPSCTCEKVLLHGLKFVCNEFLNIAYMKTELRELDGKFNIYFLEIWNSVLNYLPTSLFRWVQMKQLKIFDSIIMGLEDEVANVPEEKLERLTFNNTEGVDSWRWSSLSSLQNLWSIEIRNSDFSSVNEDFALISPIKLALIDLSNNNIDFIDEYAFSPFKKLYDITLNNNKINKISRTMFPNPANFLKTLKISDNKIQTFPNDIFVNMPVLEEVVLNNNNVKILDMKTFLPLMNRKIKIKIENNDIYCCSYLSWMIENKSKIKFTGECKRPSHLSGKRIEKLTISEFDNAEC
ncbi:connectin-like [Centruroides sculpturatus]|uniref:connectin-like n=1 Tax=Centruroides sculpturatus TaxID=218467 RepID=UPI000C6D0FC6|nr:connectin-like [Centruroides sculpturatus]